MMKVKLKAMQAALVLNLILEKKTASMKRFVMKVKMEVLLTFSRLMESCIPFRSF